MTNELGELNDSEQNTNLSTLNFGERLKNAYSDINNNKREKAEIDLNKIYSEIISLDYYEGNEILQKDLISCILGLGSINMQNKAFDKSIEFYELGDKIALGKDFNILFNLGVVYRNLGQEDKAEEYLNKAKEIESNNPNLIRFLNENNSNYTDNENSSDIQKQDSNFLSKINQMIKEINK